MNLTCEPAPLMKNPLQSSGRWVLAFMAAGLAAAVVIAAIGFVILRRTAVADALDNARDLTQAEAKVVALLITDRVMAGDRDALAILDLAVRERVLSERVVKVKVWSPDGRVVYSDDPTLVGRQFTLSGEAQEALRTGGVEVELSELSGSENVRERGYGQLIEGYTAISTTAGTPAVFEAYLRFDAVASDGSRVLGRFSPALAGGLLVLWLAQLPLAVRLSRRVQSGQTRDRAVVARAVESSERERLCIAADLHPIQPRLAGASTSLATLATAASRLGLTGLAARIEAPAEELRQCAEEVRGLLQTLDPSRLHAEGLAAALADVASGAREHGLEVDVDLVEDLHLDPTAEILVFRGAQEAVRDALTQGAAHHIGLAVANGPSAARLTVTFDRTRLEDGSAEDAAGALGLRLLGEFAAEAGGTFAVTPRPDGGTTVVLEVPQIEVNVR
jgi:two-component system, NarL family, sensor kinase